jgi:hypothetical protein
VAVGFDRTLQTTTSRGHDGQVERLSQAINDPRRTVDPAGGQAAKQREAEEKKRRQKTTKLAKVQ